MDADFAAAAAEWHDFYAAVAGAAATLVGLLFVALALSPAVMADDAPAGPRVWAGQTFHSFLVVLGIALAGLIPAESPRGLAVALLVLGAQGVARVLGDLRRVRADPDPAWGGRRARWRFASPAAAYALCLWAAAEAWRGAVAALSWLVAVLFLLTMAAAANCWDLLKAIGAPDPPGP